MTLTVGYRLRTYKQSSNILYDCNWERFRFIETKSEGSLRRKKSRLFNQKEQKIRNIEKRKTNPFG